MENEPQLEGGVKAGSHGEAGDAIIAEYEDYSGHFQEDNKLKPRLLSQAPHS